MNLEDYEKSGRARYEKLARAVAVILKHSVDSADAIANTPQVQSRAKAPESLRGKLELRGLVTSSSIEEEIKDLAGCRIIFYTDTDLERFRQSGVWEKNFDVDWANSKTHFPHSEDASVEDLYQGIHYVVRINADRVKLVEYADLAGLRCEIQLQTILNHAWSETSHDVLYKARNVAGFGTRQHELIKKRFARVMREHLMHANYEMQKIQHDAERLQAGQAVFDSAPLQKLLEARDNNERVDVLRDIRTHLLPGLDDVSIYLRDIRSTVVSAIEASRTIPVIAREGILGAYHGEKSSDVLKEGLELLDPIRYGYVDEAFDSLLTLWEGATDSADKAAIERSISLIARYSIPVWDQASAGVQVALTGELLKLSPEQRQPLRPIVLEICRATLATEMSHSEASSFDTITFSRGTVRPHDTLVVARTNAIELGLEALNASNTSGEWRQTWNALWSGTSSVSRTDRDVGLAKMQLQLMQSLCNVATERRARIPYDILQEIEEDIYWAHRRFGRTEQSARPEDLNAEIDKTRAALVACRDQLNLDERYVTYKTLVGFRTVFVEEWDQEIEIADKEKMRGDRMETYAATVGPETRDYWLSVITQCAETESDDLATFPPLTRFFNRISRLQPTIALDILLSGGKTLERFAPSFFPVLLNTAAREDALAAMNSWLPDRDAGSLGRVLFLCEEPLTNLIAQTGAQVIATKDVVGCYEIAHAALRHGNSENSLWATVLTPALATLTELDNGAFAASYLLGDEHEPKLALLPETAVKALLDNFVCRSQLGYAEEKKLTYLVPQHEALIWAMLEKRLARAATKHHEDRYEAVPEAWHGLEKKLRTNVVAVYRRLSSLADPVRNWDKAEFIAKMYQDCEDTFIAGMLDIVREDGAEAIPFACEVLRHFDGNPRVFPVCQAMVEVAPENEDVVFRIRAVIEETGVTTGEFGRAQALEAKAVQLQPWLEHQNPKVKRFARVFIDDIEKSSLDERRRGALRREIRKRDFDDPE